MEVVKNIPIPEGYRTNFPAVDTLMKAGVKTHDSVIAVDRVRYTKSAYLSEWRNLSSLVPQDKRSECKLTTPPITHRHMQVRKSENIHLFHLEIRR